MTIRDRMDEYYGGTITLNPGGNKNDVYGDLAYTLRWEAFTGGSVELHLQANELENLRDRCIELLAIRHDDA